MNSKKSNYKILTIVVCTLINLTSISLVHAKNTEQQPVVGKQYTLSTLVKYALQHNPNMEIADLMIKEEDDKINIAKSKYYPSLSLSVDNVIVDSERNTNNKNITTTVGGKYALIDFGKTKNYVAATKQGKNKQIAHYKKTQNDLVYSVTNSYIETLRYRELIALAEQQIQGFAHIVGLSKSRNTAGASALSDYTQAQIKLADAEIYLRDLQAKQAKTMVILQTLVNNYQLQADSLVKQLPKFNQNICENISRENINSPTIELAISKKNESVANLKAAKSNYLPTINLEYKYNYKLHDKSIRDTTQKRSNYVVGLNVDVPIFEGGRMVSQKELSAHTLLKDKVSIDAERQRAYQQVLEAHSQITSNKFSIDSLTFKKDFSIKTRDLYKIQYVDLGSRPLNDLLNAEADIHRSNIEIINKQYDINLLTIECLYQSGNLVDTLLH